jgi:hypothetical protein
VVGCLGPEIGVEDVEILDILLENLCVIVGDLPHRLALAVRAFFHLVFARISVRCKVTDVGYVDNMLYPVSQRKQQALEHVFKYVGAKVADVRVVVHRGTAAIHGHGVVRGHELLFAARGGIV